MKKKMIVMAVALAATACSLTAQVSVQAAETETEETASQAGYQVGDTVEEFTVTYPDGTQMTLSDMLAEHKVVYLNFWATYCQPCEKEFPALDQAWKEYQDDVYVTAVSSYYADDAQAVEEYKEQHGLSIAMAAADPALAEEYGIQSIPTSFVINQDRVVCWMESGTIPDSNIYRTMFQAFADSGDPSELVGYEIPQITPDIHGVKAASQEELTAGIGVDGETVTVKNSDEEMCGRFCRMRMADYMRPTVDTAGRRLQLSLI